MHETTPAPPAAVRARDAYAAMQARFAVAGGALYREKAPPRLFDRRYAPLWPFGQAFAAALAVAALPGGDVGALDQARRLARSHREHYWDARARPPGGASYPLKAGGGAKYYDDNCWIGLDLVALHRATGERDWLADARGVFAFVAGGWDDDPAHPAPGGIFWTQSRGNRTRDRNTVSTAPAAVLVLHLYDLTGDEAYRAWGERLFAWVERTLRDPADGLYWDHIALDGTIERTKWSYNQGAMLGAATLLWRHTRDAGMLARARAIAAAADAFYRADDRLWAQAPAFNAIFFQHCRLLAASDPAGPTAALDDLLAGYAERVWVEGRDPRTGLYHFGRRGRVTLLDQAAAVQIFALLAATGE